MRRGRTGGAMAGAVAAAAGGDSDGDSEELVLTPAQLIHSLEQVPGLAQRARAGGKRGLLGALEQMRSGGAVAAFVPLAAGV